MRTMAPINLVVHGPQTPEGRQALAQQVADVHAGAVAEQLQAQNCPISQKLALLEGILEAAQEKSKAQT